jgi:hypothetical protein
MSDYHAIGGVSTTLQTLLWDRMELPVPFPQFSVTVGLPRPEVQEPAVENARVNIFLYRVGENGAWKNQDLPGLASSGAYGKPPLSLDLYYLLTPFGTTEDGTLFNDTRAHYVLGSAMRVLHDIPVITDDLTTVRFNPGQTILDASLLGQIERIKVYLEPINLDDLSKVWTAMSLPFRASAAYQVSVVLIESEQPRTYPKLVGQPPAAGPFVTAVPFRSPQILRVGVRRPSDSPGTERPIAYARAADTLILHGQALSGSGRHVLLGGFDASSGVTAATDSAIEVTVPDNPALGPGPQTIIIRFDVPIGRSDVRPLLTSNVAVFALVPRVDSVSSNLVTNPRTVTLTGANLFDIPSSSFVIVGGSIIAGSTYTAAARNAITLPLPASLGAGTYPIRVRAAGAESLDPVAVTIP